MSKCSGQCCRKFPLPYSPGALHKAVQKAGPPLEDGVQVLAMVVYIGKFPSPGPYSDNTMHYYTCKNFHEESGSCLIYEDRPRMCRDFPSYGRGAKCHHSDCTFDDIEGKLYRLLHRVKST